MSEKSMRKRVIQALKPLHAIAVENSACIGTPDVNYIYGWIELKHLDDWPKRESTIVKIEHFTPEQRLWIKERNRHCGRIYLVLQIKLTWVILSGVWAANHLGLTATRQDIEDNAIVTTSRFHAQVFLNFFS